jgi:transcriptional regulator
VYLPAHFREDDREQLLALARANPFATLITAPDGRPYATHLPLLVSESDGEVYLRSHMARANEQWRHFADGEALAIFAGPHALVHSNWYETHPNVPTWNYAVVHARGPVSIVEGEKVREIAYGLVRALTPDMHAIPEDFERRLLAGVVTFEMRVTSLEGKFKLSQNKSRVDRGHVIEHLSESRREEERATAALMAEREGQLDKA